MEVFQTINGADLLSMIRGYDVWKQLRTMTIILLIVGHKPGKSRSKSNTFELICCPHDSIETIKAQVVNRIIQKNSVYQPSDKNHIGGIQRNYKVTNVNNRSNVNVVNTNNIINTISPKRSTIKLVHNGTLLHNSRTLSECGIVEGSTVFVLDSYSGNISPSKLMNSIDSVTNYRIPATHCHDHNDLVNPPSSSLSLNPSTLQNPILGEASCFQVDSFVSNPVSSTESCSTESTQRQTDTAF